MTRTLIPNNSRFWTVTVLQSLATIALAAWPLAAENPIAIEFNLFKLPSSRRAQEILNQPGVFTFDERPLGECLDNLAKFYRVAIWVDRRVDRSRLISIGVNVKGTSTNESATSLGRITAVAKLGGADAALIESVVYVGPAAEVAAVQLAAVRLHNQIMTYRKTKPGVANVELKAVAWAELATPADVLATIQQQWSVKVESDLPHDLMHAGQLPPSTLATQLTLLHAGFELQIDCNGEGQFAVKPLDRSAVWQASYEKKELQTARFAQARKDFPNSSVQLQGNVCTVVGPTNLHLKLFALQGPSTQNAEQKFLIPKLRAPFGKIVEVLGEKLGMQVSWSPEIPQNEKQKITDFEVTKAKTPDEILQQIAQDSGLRIERQGQKILVYPGEPK